jgi:hypothetical protein
MTKTRTEIYAADLYVLLQREFRRRQSPECANCFAQFPFRVDRLDANSPNWEVVLPPHCGYGCAAIMEELVADLAQLYDLKSDNDRGRLN